MPKLALVLLLGLITLGMSPLCGQSVVVNEVFTGSPDWVEIANLGPVPVDVGGWTVASSHGFSVYPEYLIPPGTIIAPGEGLVIIENFSNLPPNMAVPSPSTPVYNTGWSWGWIGSSSGAVLLLDPTMAAHDALVFGNGGVMIPGLNPTATFDGQVPINDADPFGSNVIQRVSTLDRDRASDWAESPDDDASPGVVNPIQVLNVVHIDRIEVDTTTGQLTFAADGSFQLSATIRALVTDDGTEITSSDWDPLIGGQVELQGFRALSTDTSSLSGVILASVQGRIRTASSTTDDLYFVNNFHSATFTRSTLGGPSSTRPQHYRSFNGMVTNAGSRGPEPSAVLDAVATRMQSETLYLEFRLENNTPRLERVCFRLPTFDPSFRVAADVDEHGAFSMGAVGAPASELYFIFVFNPTYAAGYGPIAGIEFGPFQYEMLVAPLGTEPFHVPADGFGAYGFELPAGIIPPGWVIDILPGRLHAGAIDILSPLRLSF